MIIWPFIGNTTSNIKKKKLTSQRHSGLNRNARSFRSLARGQSEEVLFQLFFIGHVNDQILSWRWLLILVAVFAVVSELVHSFNGFVDYGVRPLWDLVLLLQH